MAASASPDGRRATCTPASGSVFDLGATPVTCTASDADGNTALITFQVVVATSVARSGSGTVSRTGGTVETADGQVRLDLPPDATAFCSCDPVGDTFEVAVTGPGRWSLAFFDLAPPVVRDLAFDTDVETAAAPPPTTPSPARAWRRRTRAAGGAVGVVSRTSRMGVPGSRGRVPRGRLGCASSTLAPRPPRRARRVRPEPRRRIPEP